MIETLISKRVEKSIVLIAFLPDKKNTKITKEMDKKLLLYDLLFQKSIVDATKVNKHKITERLMTDKIIAKGNKTTPVKDDR